MTQRIEIEYITASINVRDEKSIASIKGTVWSTIEKLIALLAVPGALQHPEAGQVEYADATKSRIFFSFKLVHSEERHVRFLVREMYARLYNKNMAQGLIRSVTIENEQLQNEAKALYGHYLDAHLNPIPARDRASQMEEGAT
jgi:hypothetical protein